MEKEKKPPNSQRKTAGLGDDWSVAISVTQNAGRSHVPRPGIDRSRTRFGDEAVRVTDRCLGRRLEHCPKINRIIDEDRETNLHSLLH